MFNVEIGQLQDCSGYNAFDVGCDLLFSEKVMITGCDFRSAGGIGIDATDTTSCSIFGNDVTGYTTEGIDTAGSTTIELGPNQGHLGATLNTVISDHPNDDLSSSGTYPTTYTIPADTLKVGDCIKVSALCDVTGWTSGTVTFSLRIGGSTFALTDLFNAAGEAYVVGEMHIVALTGADNIRYRYFCVSDTVNEIVINAGNITEDLTADQDIDCVVTISNTATAKFDTILIELLGGNS